MRRIFCRFLLVAAGLSAFSSFSAERATALSFKLPVLPEVQRHLYLLENPAYLALALENSGMNISLSSRPVLKGRTGFEIRNIAVLFSGKSGSTYRYIATLKFSLGGVATEITVPAEVDISAIGAGSLDIKAYPPMAGAMPAALLERVDFKLKFIADLSRQQEILRYLDSLPQKSLAEGLLDPRLEAILTEAYNRSTILVVPARDNGEATPLLEQIGLIITISIWLVGLPVILIFRYRRNLRRLRTKPDDGKSN